MLGLLLGMAMVCNMFVAATAGTLVPLGLKAMKVDPALASSVFITTFTDVVGFASFLGLATIFLRFLGPTYPVNAAGKRIEWTARTARMPLYTAEALVLRTYKLGEADRIVVFLTRDRGKKRGVAPVRRRPRSRFSGALEPLTEVRVAYFEKERRELVKLNYAEPVRSPLSIAEPGGLGYSHYFAELIDAWAADADADERLFRLGVSALEALAAATPVEALARYFECWLLRLQGVYPPEVPAALSATARDGVPRDGTVRRRSCHGAQDRRPAFARRWPQRPAVVLPRSSSCNHPARARVRTVAHLEKELQVGSRDERTARDSPHVTFQDLILKLSAFWASRGCLIQQPLDLEVGAGTSHPETLLRVLGPEPWNVAYVQPSRRPDDGRFGQNPNRLFKHHQMQVILKPSPDEVQQIYLDSLEACGINPRQHDIRFEEDNWESPTLGAWGIGWQVMLDGTEITQFTYFQQVGGVDLSPVSGRDHLRPRAHRDVPAEGRQRVRPRVGGGVKYGEVRLREEVEQSKYAFNQDTGIDRGRLRRVPPRPVRRDYYEFGERLLKGGLLLPALEYCLKCSHLFNLLDSSGSIGVTERTAYILRVRQLALAICAASTPRTTEAAAPGRAAEAE